MDIPHSCDYCIHFCFNNSPYCEAKEKILPFHSDKQIQAARKCDDYESTPISFITQTDISEKDKPEKIPDWIILEVENEYIRARWMH